MIESDWREITREVLGRSTFFFSKHKKTKRLDRKTTEYTVTQYIIYRRSYNNIPTRLTTIYTVLKTQAINPSESYWSKSLLINRFEENHRFPRQRRQRRLFRFRLFIATLSHNIRNLVRKNAGQ